MPNLKQKRMVYIIKPNWNLNLGKNIFPEFKFDSYKKLSDFVNTNQLLISHQSSTKHKTVFIYF